MKKVFVAISLICAFSLLPASEGFAGITGTDHDLSSYSGGDRCAVCHTPHGNVSSVPDAPFWNHAVTNATFTVYSSATMNASVGQPNGTSKLCLSCHDGTVAVDSFGGTSGSNFISGGALVGTDLSNDHPVSFTYDTTLASADGGLYDPATRTSGLGGTITNDMLFNGKVECASCHDVHDNTYDPFLRKSNSSSALCLTCHSY